MDQLEGSTGDHAQCRRLVMDYIESHKADFASFVEDNEPFDKYVARLRRNASWGGDLELKAASLVFQVNINIHKDKAPVVEIRNFPPGKARVLHLSYHDGNHYNSVRPIDDTSDGPAAHKASPAAAPMSACTHPSARAEPWMVDLLCDMGFEREKAVHALQVTDGNLPRAVDHVLAMNSAGKSSVGPPCAPMAQRAPAAVDMEARVKAMTNLGYKREQVKRALCDARNDPKLAMGLLQEPSAVKRVVRPADTVQRALHAFKVTLHTITEDRTSSVHQKLVELKALEGEIKTSSHCDACQQRGILRVLKRKRVQLLLFKESTRKGHGELAEDGVAQRQNGLATATDVGGAAAHARVAPRAEGALVQTRTWLPQTPSRTCATAVMRTRKRLIRLS
eukprot:jgi/Mesvir1/15739/Mv03312-RA.1